MTLRDIPLFLLGRRESIQAIAGSRHALWVGLVLVLTGSLARNYDGAYLPAEWHVLLHGVVVSIINALILHTLLYLSCRGQANLPYFASLRVFLTLFWMTAPMAWLYAIPYERFVSPEEAVWCNAWTLAFVSVWRVALITRVLSVLWGARPLLVLLIVLAFADVTIFLATLFAPVPVVNFMGGMEHSPAEQALAGLNFLAGFWTFVLALPLLITGGFAVYGIKGQWAAALHGGRVARSVWVFVALVCAAWAWPLSLAQPEQKLRHDVESLLRAGNVSAALAVMSSHERVRFPAHWDPPPRKAYREATPSMDSIRTSLAEGGQAAWVRTVYLDKSGRSLSPHMRWYQLDPGTVGTGEQELRQYVAMRDADEELRRALEFHIKHDERFTDED